MNTSIWTFAPYYRHCKEFLLVSLSAVIANIDTEYGVAVIRYSVYLYNTDTEKIQNAQLWKSCNLITKNLKHINFYKYYQAYIKNW